MTVITPQQYFADHFRDDFYLFIRGAHVHERDGNLYIPIQNLKKERLSHIPGERVHMFYYALALVSLVDIIMEQYFEVDYLRFQAMTQYPKFEQGVSTLRAGPWQLAELDFKPATFQSFCRVFLDDQKNFFKTHSFKTAD
jgi:hypothetical protein